MWSYDRGGGLGFAPAVAPPLRPAVWPSWKRRKWEPAGKGPQGAGGISTCSSSRRSWPWKPAPHWSRPSRSSPWTGFLARPQTPGELRTQCFPETKIQVFWSASTWNNLRGLIRHRPVLLEVALVPHQEPIDNPACISVDLAQPLLHVVEALPHGHVVHYLPALIPSTAAQNLS